MTQENTLLGLLAQTSIHAGTGQNTGIIDLPIQREGHNGWPCVFGSAVKGAMRSHAEDKASSSIDIVFGPSSSDAAYASAITISDARLVLFPVRSLTSQFKWISCPAALQRLKQDMRRFGFNNVELDNLNMPTKEQAYIPKIDNNNTTNTADSLFLEEYRFSTEQQTLDKTILLLSQLMKTDDAIARLEQQLVILSDDMFSYLVQHATPVNAHIAIETEAKTVKDGALWYEETLPPETLLYLGLSAVDARNGDANCPASTILNSVTGMFSEKPWLQIGGNETVGMGWCAISDLRDAKKEG